MDKKEVMNASLRLDKKMSNDFKVNKAINEEDWAKYLKLVQEYYGK